MSRYNPNLKKISLKDLMELYDCSQATAFRKKQQLIQWYNDVKGTKHTVLQQFMLDLYQN